MSVEIDVMFIAKNYDEIFNADAKQNPKHLELKKNFHFNKAHLLSICLHTNTHKDTYAYGQSY